MSVRVRRANGERIIPDEKVAEYLEMGYSVLDAKDNVVKRPEPKTIPELKAALAEKDTVTSCNGPANTDEQDTPTISPSEDKNGATAPSEKKKTKPASKPE